jgi:hypothetical protein
LNQNIKKLIITNRTQKILETKKPNQTENSTRKPLNEKKIETQIDNTATTTTTTCRRKETKKNSHFISFPVSLRHGVESNVRL